MAPAASYSEAIAGLEGLAGELVTRPGQPRRKFRLEDMRMLLAELGDPQLRFPSVLIAGTNGKGSTAATLASILAAAGYRVGLYTSPHLSRVNERIQVLDGDGSGRAAEIPDDAFAKAYFAVDAAASSLVTAERLPDHSSFFEAITALAFLHFAEEAVDVAVLEVGMGGRLDATNVVEPLISIITDISLDHMEWLGSTVDAIAREKAGILRPGGVMVTLPQHREANEALGEIAVGLGVRGVNAAQYIPAPGAAPGAGRNSYVVDVMGDEIEIDSPLAGQHQQRNVALAIAAAVELRHHHGYNLSASDLAHGVASASWPGRLELFPATEARAEFLLDVAHNPAGAWALRSGLSGVLEPYPGRFTTLIFGCLRDKALEEMAQILFPLFDRVVVTEVESPRTASLTDLVAAGRSTGAEVEGVPDAEASIELAGTITPADGLVVVAGSVYLVGRVRQRLVEDRER